jgi:hypothetical protein
VLEELAVTAFRFAEEHRLCQTKAWAFLSILMLLHRTSMKEQQPLRMEDSFALFKRLLVAHSIQRPPYSVRVFSLDESKLLTRYVTHTYYLHYRLYLYVFTKRRLLDLSQRQLVINVAPDIPALATATLLSATTPVLAPAPTSARSSDAVQP